MMRRNQDQQSRIFYELSSLVLNLLRSPTVTLTEQSREIPSSANGRRQSRNEITPAGLASLMLGISLALMLCGTVTFFIGFLLMPWVLGLVLVFYVAGIVSSISMLGRMIFSHALPPPPPPRKDIPDSKLCFPCCGMEAFVKH